MNHTTPLIELKYITKTFAASRGNPPLEVLKGVNLAVYRKDFVVITGSSGSGKSTLLGIITGLHKPTEGMIIYDGKPNPKNRDRIASHFRRDYEGFVFQSFNLIPYITVLENVMAPLKFSSVPASTHWQTAIELLEKMGISDKYNYYPNQLSGGQIQRVAIARALVRNPKLIIADEPTGNLDTTTAETILEIIDELHNRDGISFIIVTHSPIVMNRAKRRFMLSHGVLTGD